MLPVVLPPLLLQLLRRPTLLLLMHQLLQLVMLIMLRMLMRLLRLLLLPPLAPVRRRKLAARGRAQLYTVVSRHAQLRIAIASNKLYVCSTAIASGKTSDQQ